MHLIEFCKAKGNLLAQTETATAAAVMRKPTEKLKTED